MSYSRRLLSRGMINRHTLLCTRASICRPSHHLSRDHFLQRHRQTLLELSELTPRFFSGPATMHGCRLPTFLYAMPFSPTRIFLEETSLVARPIVEFSELKARLDARLKHLGITIKASTRWEGGVRGLGGW